MTIEQAFYARLAADAGVAALVNGRVYPLILPQTATFPAVTYFRVTGGRRYTHDGPDSLAAPQFQVSCWAQTYAACKGLAAAVVAAINGYRGIMGGAGGVMVQAVVIDGEMDQYEPDTGIYQIAITATIWHEEG